MSRVHLVLVSAGEAVRCSAMKGELLVLRATPGDAAAAAEYFEQAIDWARRQDARVGGRPMRAKRWRRCTRRFTEGFTTADLVAAKTLLASLRD